MSDGMNAQEFDLLDELPKLAPPDNLVVDVECLAFQELEASHTRLSLDNAKRSQTVVVVPRYEIALHAMLVVAYSLCAAHAALRVLQHFIAG
ncbi:MAG: hypothetical protein QM784_09850 [Polyangiaceae bacterium]